MKSILTLLILVFYPLMVFCQPVAFNNPEKGFVSWKPAPAWEDAMLSGNGTIGAMVFGNPHDETIILNHALCYLPMRTPPQPINQASRLTEIRALLSGGKFVEASKIPVNQSNKEGINEMLWIDPFVPFANLKVSMQPGNISNYKRIVDFETGEAKVEWAQDGHLFQRVLFVSRKDNVVVMRIQSTGKINCAISVTNHPVAWDQWSYVKSNIKKMVSSADGQYVLYQTEFVNQWEGSVKGFEGVGEIINRGGQIKTQGAEVLINNADEVLFLMTIEPNYNFSNSLVTTIKNKLKGLNPGYDDLLASHVKIHGGLFGRVNLDLGGGADNGLQAEAMVLKARREVSPAIIETQFNAARYNIISSVGTNPPNLQGIWSGTWTPPWSSGFTHDGNVEVAVSSLLVGNTPELMKVYIEFHNRMMPHYRKNAKMLFGTGGIVIPAHSSTHGLTIHFNETWCLSFWTAGAGWTAGIMYDYFLYTGDKEYLRKMIYPFMRETALFYEDFLITGDDGKYIFSPSYSPENNPSNGSSQACINATMDVMVARELLQNCIEAAKILGEDNNKIQLWGKMLSKMPSYRINNDGALAEWLLPGMDDNYGHRHVSHLYSLFERISPEFKNNAELFKAAAQAVEKRMVHRRLENGGEMVFGLAQMGMVTANISDRVKTEEIINWISKYYWSASLATFHNSGNLFNMDVSGGFPAVILRSLAYSEPGYINLLPALPLSWNKGSVEGMALRGQIVINKLSWGENHLEVTLTSRTNQKVEIGLPNQARHIDASISKRFKIDKNKPTSLLVNLKPDQPIKINIKF